MNGPFLLMRLLLVNGVLLLGLLAVLIVALRKFSAWLERLDAPPEEEEEPRPARLAPRALRLWP